MKFAKKTDKVFTIIYTVISLLSIIILIVAAMYPGKFINNISGMLSPANYQSYNVNSLLSLMVHAYVGSVSIVLLYVLAVYAVLFGLPIVFITIFSYIRIILYKKTRNPKHIRRNLIVKLIYTSIWTILSLIMTIKDIGFVVVFVSLAVVLSILFAAVYDMREHKYFAQY
ncbi:MAG: hypothetical protein KHX32_05475 [Clostridiales bacterium]|nr:hypothetical protein [Clostridiales bacterium]